MTLTLVEDASVTDELMRKAEQELGETEEKKKRCLHEFRKKIEELKLFLPVQDDNFLLMILRARKFKLEKAMENIVTMCQTNRDYQDIFHIESSDQVIRLLRDKVVSVLPYRAEDGSLIMLIRLGPFKFGKVKFSNLLGVLAFIAVLLMSSNARNQIGGLNVIIDCNDTSVTNVRFISMRHVYLVGKGVKNILPARVKGIHFVNTPTPFRVMANIMRSLVTDKLQQRYHFHANAKEGLLKCFSPSVLPREYGGTCECDNESFINWIKLHERRGMDISTLGLNPE